MRPEELAPELGISPKTLRQWLRDTFTRPAAVAYQPWRMTAKQVVAACRRFL
jgi:predicted site-specific integrase-resolvase